MNKGLKITAMVAAVLLALGVILALVGYSMGGFRAIVYRNGSWNVQPDVIAGELVEEIVDEEFYNVNIQVDSQRVKFIESDSYKVVYTYDDGVDVMSHRLDGDTLYVTGQTRRNSYNGMSFNLFGSSYNGSLSNRTSTVNVYYPKGAELGTVIINSDAADVNLSGFSAEKLELSVDFGSVKMEDIYTERLYIDADAGDVTLRNVTSEKSEIDMDFGRLKTDDFTSTDLAVDSDAGDISLKGEFYGRTLINCDFGTVTVETGLAKEEYSYDIGVEFGKLTFDGDNRGSIGANFTGGTGEHYLEIRASAGDVNVKFD